MTIRQALTAEYRSISLSRKILAVFLAVLTLLVSIILVISYNLSAVIIRGQTQELVQENLNQSAGNIRSSLENYNSIIQEIYTNTDYIDELQVVNSWDGEDSYLSRHTLEDQLRSIIYMNSDILGIALYGKYGDRCLYDAITGSGQESLCFPDEFKNSSLIKEATNQNESVYSSLTVLESAEYGEHSCFYIVHRLVDFNRYKRGAIGCIVLCIDEGQFRQVYSNGNESSSLSFLTDAYGNLFSFPAAGYAQQNIFAGDGADTAGYHALVDEQPASENVPQDHLSKTDERSTTSQHDDTELTRNRYAEAAVSFVRNHDLFVASTADLDVNVQEILDGHFRLINIQDLSDSLMRLRYLLALICLAAGLAAMLCLLLVLYMSEDINHSVQQILRAMNEANEGNRDSHIAIEGADEFARISNHFNAMLSEIKKAEDQERDSLRREKNAEIRSLEAQINPHFLYNTLDAINWVAIGEGQFSISQMVTRLAQILRYSIHNSNEIVTLETELDYLRKYIYLQQQRFDYSFDCDIEMDDSVKDCRIHKLLFQPLVENTIVHGFSGLDHPGRIHILIEMRAAGRLLIEIRDNGVGMSAEQVDEFNHYDYRSARIETSIGVRNVITRLHLYYGDEALIHFASDASGTTVRIEIPEEAMQQPEEEPQ